MNFDSFYYLFSPAQTHRARAALARASCRLRVCESCVSCAESRETAGENETRDGALTVVRCARALNLSSRRVTAPALPLPLWRGAWLYGFHII